MVKFLKVNQKRHIIIWHGGEPLLRGIDFYRQAIEIQKFYIRKMGLDHPITNRIQTNGTLINSDWAKFIKRNDFKVGISIDGPKNLHNSHRFFPNRIGSYKESMRGYSILKEEGIKVGVGAVITSENSQNPKTMFDFFVSNFKVFNFSPCFESLSEKKLYGLNPEEYTIFFKKVFDLWWELDNKNIRIRTFRDFIIGALGFTPKICSLSSRCKNFLCIDAEGEIFPCGKMSDLKDLHFGSIIDTDLIDLYSQKSVVQYYQKAEYLSEDCLVCEWKNACNNFCTETRYQGNSTYIDKTPYCNSIKEIYSYVEKKIGPYKNKYLNKE